MNRSLCSIVDSFSVLHCDMSSFLVQQKLLQNDPRVAVVIKRSFNVKLLERSWKVHAVVLQTRALLTENSFSENQKVRKLQRSRKSCIYHIFLTNTVNNFVVLLYWIEYPSQLIFTHHSKIVIIDYSAYSH